MRNAIFPGSVLLLALVTAGPSAASAQIDDVLRNELGFTNRNIKELERGMAVVVVPEVDDQQDVAVFGAIRVAVPVEFLLERARDIEGILSRSDVVKSGGRLTVGAPSSGWLELPRQDIDAMRACRPEECDVKLSAELIERMSREIDWSERDRAREANAFMERVLQEYLEEYAAAGSSELMTYNDRAEPMSVGEGVRYLVSLPAFTENEAASALRRYLEAYPLAGDESAEDIFYWSVEDFGLKPTLLLTHVVIGLEQRDAVTRALMGSVQIYANHYFQAGVDLLLFASVSESDPVAGTYLVYLAWGRFDGKLGGFQRTLLTDRLRKKSRFALEVAKDRLERAHTGSS